MTSMSIRTWEAPTTYPAGTTLCMFGGPYIVADGRRLSVPEGSKRLLVFVAMHGPRVDRRHAAGVLWPHGGDERAAGNLRSALWRLKTAGIDLVEADKAALYLRARTAVDLDLLHAWAGRVIGGAPEPGDLEVEPFGPEVEDMLPGWYDDWVIFERERIRQRLLHAYEELSRHLVRIGRRAQAVEAAMAAVNVEPLRESAQRALVEAHLAEGNVFEAVRCFRAFDQLIRQELGIAPDPELAGLCGLAEDPATVPRQRLPVRSR